MCVCVKEMLVCVCVCVYVCVNVLWRLHWDAVPLFQFVLSCTRTLKP
jgi:hypothetical protein